MLSRLTYMSECISDAFPSFVLLWRFVRHLHSRRGLWRPYNRASTHSVASKATFRAMWRACQESLAMLSL